MDYETLINSLSAAQFKILQDIVDLVPREERAKAARLMEDFRRTSNAIKAMEPPPGIDPGYGALDSNQAVVKYLTDVGHALTEVDIKDGVLSKAAPFLKGSTDKVKKGNVQKALNMFLQGGGGEHKNILRRGPHGLIGLYEWDDSKFTVLW